MSAAVRRSSIVLVSLFVAACVSNSGVAPLGHGYLMVSRQTPAALIDPARLKAETLREAEAHCTGLGRTLDVLRVIETGPPQVLVSRVEVQFTCRAAGG